MRAVSLAERVGLFSTAQATSYLVADNVLQVAMPALAPARSSVSSKLAAQLLQLRPQVVHTLLAEDHPDASSLRVKLAQTTATSEKEKNLFVVWSLVVSEEYRAWLSGEQISVLMAFLYIFSWRFTWTVD